MIHYLVTDYTINFPTTWFTADRWAEFWQYVKWFLKFCMPLMMMVLALELAGFFGETTVDVVKTARSGRKDDDDVDVEYY